MNCVEWEERIALYAGGDLSSVEARAVEDHVGECSGCQVLLSGLRESLALVREAHAEPIEAANFAAVRARVLSELARGPARRWRFAWLGALAAAAALLFVTIWPPSPEKRAEPVAARGADPLVRVGPPASAIREAGNAVPARVRRTEGRPRTGGSAPPRSVQQVAAPPTVVKLLTDDPNVVIYWITDTKGE